jgi:thioredoxin reductase/NAD-dependent dihydropyrimidine dehydrogenase PreA subunit
MRQTTLVRHIFASIQFLIPGGDRGERLDPGTAVLAAGALVCAAVAAGHVLRRGHRERSSAAAVAARAPEERIPLTLHPVINPDICIGSLSCLESCPEGDILGIVDGAARLIKADNCIGHGRCAAECPVGAIKLVFGTSERGVDLPMLDQYFESSRPGVHIVGELGGMGLIRNAVTQGVQVAERLATTLRRRSTPEVVIVGAGPAGLATAFALKAARRSFRILEQGTLGGTIANFPRHKVVMTEPIDAPYLGKVSRQRISKEELLELWQDGLDKARIRIDEGVRVLGVDGNDGAFRVQTDKGYLDAAKVVLATGRRGTPRKLGVPGETLAKVTYRLIDAEQYGRSEVLVVGGGDAAVEAAIQLAEQSSAKVSISYRGDSFTGCREANRRRIAELIQAKRVRALMSSQVEKILEKEVVLTASGSPVVLRNDYVIVNIGGQLPLEFLARLHVSLKRHFGEELKKPTHARGIIAPLQRETAPSRRGVHLLYLATGALIIGWLAIHGWDYYLLSRTARLASPLHQSLRPAGRWGHGVGIVATAFMFLNFLYPVRKRSRALSGVGSIRAWLDFHVFVGFMSPMVIAFHSAFQSNNQLATGTAAALLIVVLTGIFGRFIYGLVPSDGGKAVELSEVTSRWEKLRARLKPIFDGSDDPALLHRMFDDAARPARRGSLPVFLFSLPFAWLSLRLRLLRARFHLERPAYREFRAGSILLARLRVQIGFYKSLKRLLSGWRLFHASLAGFLVVAISAHIAVSVYLGYVWFR